MVEIKIQRLINEAVARAYPKVSNISFDLRHPELQEHGDYSANIALVLAKSLHKNPLEVAESIAAAIPPQDWLQKIDVARPGFINFYLTNQFQLDELERIITLGDNYGKIIPTDQSQRLSVEFGQPNTHKIPHIGHLFSYCYGESLARLLEFSGAKVSRANYQGDIGLHVAKCLWAYERHESKPSLTSTDEKVEYLQKCYQEGSAAYEQDEAAKQAIDHLNKAIYQNDPAILSTWQQTKQWSLDYYRQFEQELGISYDHYYLESQVAPVGLALVKKNVPKVFQEDQGAIIFRGEQYNLHTRVFVNRFGNPTYETKDIGLACAKLNDEKDDCYIVTTANEQNEYWQVVKKAIELTIPALQGKINHIGYGMINLSTGKMSSRTGQIVTAFSLIEMVKDRVREYIKENRDYSDHEREKIASLVALGAIKYSFLKSSPTKNITFDLESSISFDGNSGPYLQYTYARCQSVIKKAPDSPKVEVVEPKQLNAEELGVLKALHRFPEVVALAAREYAPHILATYLFELAQSYSYFYNQHQILVDDKPVAQFRLALTKGVAQILKSGLNLLGIEAANKI